MRQSDREIIGMVGLRWPDLRLSAHVDDSYFQIYPGELLEALNATSGHQIMIMEYLGIHPAWRRRALGAFAPRS